MAKEVKITLSEPVSFDGKSYTELVLKKFKAKHFKIIPKNFWIKVEEMMPAEGEESATIDLASNMEFVVSMMPLMASMAEVPEGVIDELEISDLIKVSGELAPFLEESLKMGES